MFPFVLRLLATMYINRFVRIAECKRQTVLDDHWAHPGFVCNGTRRCISQFVVCDGYDHCGDRGDEDETWCEGKVFK